MQSLVNGVSHGPTANPVDSTPRVYCHAEFLPSCVSCLSERHSSLTPKIASNKVPNIFHGRVSQSALIRSWRALHSTTQRPPHPQPNPDMDSVAPAPSSTTVQEPHNGNSHKKNISHLAYKTFISIASGQRVYTHTQLRRPKHTTSTKVRTGDKSGQENLSHRGTARPSEALRSLMQSCTQQKSFSTPALRVKEWGISDLLFVRRLNGGELLLPLCETFGDDSFVLRLLGLLVVNAPVLEGAEVAAALEPDGGYEALDLRAAPERKGDIHLSVPHRRKAFGHTPWYMASLLPSSCW